MSGPRTVAGRALAQRAEREAFGHWEGIREFEVPAIETQAAKAAVLEVLDRLALAHRDGDHRDGYCHEFFDRIIASERERA